jgi:hypothetical protein
MKIQQLIDQLESIKDKQDELIVYIKNGECHDFYNIDHIAYHNNEDEFYLVITD